MATKSVERIKVRLANNPLYFVENGEVMCAACGGKGKKVPLYRICNYLEFQICKVCKENFSR